MNVLVTGGAGFIGSHTCDVLISRGHHVTILDDLSTGYAENLNVDARFVKGSILDLAPLEEATRGQDAIVHLAAFTSVPDSFAKHEECFEVNVGGTFRVLDSAVEQGVGRVVFASSSAVYSDVDTNVKKESDCPLPGSPYAVSKIEGEHLLARYRERHGIGFAALRYFNVYGPRQRADSDYAAAIPIFASKSLCREPLTVYGDGTQTRDLVFVDDVARANVAAVTSNSSGVFNVGTGEATEILALAREMTRLCGSDSVQIRFEPPRAGDALSSEADIGAVERELGWSPSVSLSVGLDSTLEWWREQVDTEVSGG